MASDTQSGTESGGAAIEDYFSEDRTFPPPADFAADALVTGAEIYDEAEADWQGFWARQAADLVSWYDEWHTVLEWDQPFAKWFVGGTLNVSYNCLDRHVEAGQGQRVAYHWEGEPGDTRTITYADLLDEVQRFANVLKDLGVRRGDRVAIYMPMIDTAETVAKRYNVSREAQDAYGLSSQQRTAAAQLVDGRSPGGGAERRIGRRIAGQRDTRPQHRDEQDAEGDGAPHVPMALEIDLADDRVVADVLLDRPLERVSRHARLAAHQRRSALRSLALRARGLRSISACAGTCGRFVRTAASPAACWARRVCLTIRSSSE